jgi:hypothetical protein
MTPKKSSKQPLFAPDEETPIRVILGYLNFSSGTPDPAFQRNFNEWIAALPANSSACEMRDALHQCLLEIGKTTPAFADLTQAQAAIRLLFDECFPSYCRHHDDLLFHLGDKDFLQPFFLARYFEAVLSTGPPWNETERIVGDSLEQMNDFLGHRPLAVLENNRQMQPYAHERFRPIPLYIHGAGVAFGQYHDLISRTLEFFRNSSEEILDESYFDLSLLDELALDVRAHDHTHPMNKRTNYMFGEWDPHTIDNQGRYRRFVLRRLILDSLLDWMKASNLSRDEALYDASAVLCGTMLMASAISGSGPDTHDSSVTLTALLPRVARQRDAFYARLLDEATGPRSKRLLKQAKLTHQPFGHVRKDLNLRLTGYGARQLQNRQIAYLFARMGFSEEARDRASLIPSASARIESEIQWRITAAQRHLDSAHLSAAVQLIGEVEDHLQRGIECGALPDPWNILGFQGQFPLFSSREDSVPDQRIEILLNIMEQVFNLYSRALGEAAVEGNKTLSSKISNRHLKLAEFWDQFATTVVSDLPKVSGRESWESATRVAQALRDWQLAGEAAGDISFWRRHVEQFESAGAYAQVVESLLQKQDHVAAMGLMMQWLSQAEDVGLESAGRSIYTLLQRWMRLVTGKLQGKHGNLHPDFRPIIRRLFDYLEANAGEFWHVPSFDSLTDDSRSITEEALPEEWDEEQDEEFPQEEDNLFEAAYEGVIYRDSSDDGNFEDTLDDGYAPLNTEFEIIFRELEPRLTFLETLAELWQSAATTLVADPASLSSETAAATHHKKENEQAKMIASWHGHVIRMQKDLIRLLNAVHHYEIGTLPGDVDANMELDVQLQTKFFLMHTILNACLQFRTTEWHLLACLPEQETGKKRTAESRLVADLCRSVIRGDVVSVKEQLPKFLKRVSKKPLLYVSLENDGTPQQVLTVRTLQTAFRFLLEQLPRLGLLHETWQVLNAAYRMERGSRPAGPAVTEFDRLFKTALKGTLQCVARSTGSWRDVRLRNQHDRKIKQHTRRRHLGDRPVPTDIVLRNPSTQAQQYPHRNNVTLDLVDRIVERYHELWLKYSRGIRLSRVEELKQKAVWDDVVEFVTRYGADLFHAGMLTLGNVRSILHSGVDDFLEYLDEYQDPLTSFQLLDDLDEGRIELSQAVRMMEVIYESFLDKLDLYIEYNTTTTQSDYGELFYYLLDFLRVENGYERDAWNFLPFTTAHETLCETQQRNSVSVWETFCERKVDQLGMQHLAKLKKLEKKYGMQLPSVTDLLNERFVKGLAVNRMHALIPRTIEENRLGSRPSASFRVLKEEIDNYLQATTGSAFDVPVWLQSLEQEVAHADEKTMISQANAESVLKQVLLSRRQLLKQLEHWDQPLDS